MKVYINDNGSLRDLTKGPTARVSDLWCSTNKSKKVEARDITLTSGLVQIEATVEEWEEVMERVRIEINGLRLEVWQKKTAEFEAKVAQEGEAAALAQGLM
jgi:hypothetical protein